MLQQVVVRQQPMAQQNFREQLHGHIEMLCEYFREVAAYQHSVVQLERERILAVLAQYSHICAALKTRQTEIVKLHALIKHSIELQAAKRMEEVKLQINRTRVPSGNLDLEPFKVNINLEIYQAIVKSAEMQQFVLTPPSHDMVKLAQTLIPGSPLSNTLNLEYKAMTAPLLPSIESLPLLQIEPGMQAFVNALLGQTETPRASITYGGTLFQPQGAPPVTTKSAMSSLTL